MGRVMDVAGVKVIRNEETDDGGWGADSECFRDLLERKALQKARLCGFRAYQNISGPIQIPLFQGGFYLCSRLSIGQAAKDGVGAAIGAPGGKLAVDESGAGGVRVDITGDVDPRFPRLL